MPNQGFLRLGLIDVEGRPARDARVDVVLFGGTSPRRELKKFSKRTFPPRWHDLVVPAYPEEFVLSLDIMPSRFRARSSGVFSITDSETVERNLTVFPRPEGWSARFVSWNRLPAAFASLKRVLRGSTERASVSLRRLENDEVL